MKLTPEQTWLFRIAGFVKLPEVLPEETVAGLKEAIRQDMDAGLIRLRLKSAATLCKCARLMVR